jgi:hypothetical protein
VASAVDDDAALRIAPLITSPWIHFSVFIVVGRGAGFSSRVDARDVARGFAPSASAASPGRVGVDLEVEPDDVEVDNLILVEYVVTSWVCDRAAITHCGGVPR